MIEKAIQFGSKFLSRKLAAFLVGTFAIQRGAVDDPVQMAVTGLITIVYVLVQGRIDRMNIDTKGVI